ncbi:MAG: DUF1045 domain-containing protein [Granulosicoccus sp.]
MSARYAVFFCPDDASDLAAYGRQVLGRGADGSQFVAPNDGFPDQHTWTELAATPAHYGFHATLKAPFHLAEGLSEEGLLTAVERLAMQQKCIIMQSLKPRVLSGFAALCFENQPPAVAELASQCVEQLELFRAPLTQADLNRRNPDQLNDSQRKNLFRFGYPYVMDEFRFHMTLTGTLQLSEHREYFNWLQKRFDSLVPDAPTLDRLAVFWQPDRKKAFTRLEEFLFPRSALRRH